MTLAELITHFRELANDKATPYLWSDSLLESYAVLAEQEACSRRALLTSSTDTTICEIAVTDGTAVYTKHTAIRQVYKAELIETADATNVIDLYITDVDELNYIDPDWQSLTGEPKYMLLDDTKVELIPTPEADASLWLNVSHIPLTDMDNVTPTPKPTIDVAHHFMLVFYMLYLAYSKPDPDAFNKNKAAESEAVFIAYFGDRPDAYRTKSVRQVRTDRQPSGWI